MRALVTWILFRDPIVQARVLEVMVLVQQDQNGESEPVVVNLTDRFFAGVGNIWIDLELRCSGSVIDLVIFYSWLDKIEDWHYPVVFQVYHW